jgi:hypothetical protein
MPLLPFNTFEKVSQGYINYRGADGKVEADWYPEEEMPRPKKYHENISKESQTYKDMYEDLIEV